MRDCCIRPKEIDWGGKGDSAQARFLVYLFSGVNHNYITYWQIEFNYYIVESLQSHMILTMSHWSSGLTCLLPATRVTCSNPLGGTYVEPGFSC